MEQCEFISIRRWPILRNSRSSKLPPLTSYLSVILMKYSRLLTYWKTGNADKLSKDERKIKRWTLLSEINKYKVPIPLYCLNAGYAKYLGINGSPYKILSMKYNVACLNAGYEYDDEIGFTGKTIDLEEYYDFDKRCF